MPPFSSLRRLFTQAPSIAHQNSSTAHFSTHHTGSEEQKITSVDRDGALKKLFFKMLPFFLLSTSVSSNGAKPKAPHQHSLMGELGDG